METSAINGLKPAYSFTTDKVLPCQKSSKPGMVIHTRNPSTQKAQVGGLEVQSYAWLHKFEACWLHKTIIYTMYSIT